MTSFLKGRENILIPHTMSHCGPTQLQLIYKDGGQRISVRQPWVVNLELGVILKFRSFWFSFLACRGDKNKVEEELTTTISTDFQIRTQSLGASKQWKADKIEDSNLPVTPVRIYTIELFFTECSVLLIMNKGKLKNCVNSSVWLSSVMAARQISCLFAARTPRLAGI